MNPQNFAPEATNEMSFEAAFARLEEILEKMNSGTISLDASLKFYEEADALILKCNKRLVDAERKIEILIKNRSGELTMGTNQKPMTQDFNIPANTSLKQ
ncbi:MAG: exodeoxyribonuclease VII small subunit [Parachlamydiaceae bacterium]